MSDWTPARTARGLRKDAEAAFARAFERLVVCHAPSKKAVALALDIPPKHLCRFFESGGRNLPAGWLALLPAEVEVSYLRDRAAARGFELRPLTSCDEHPHDVPAVAKELGEAVVATVDAAAKGTHAARERARQELHEAMRTCAAAIDSLDRQDAEDRRLVGAARRAETTPAPSALRAVPEAARGSR